MKLEVWERCISEVQELRSLASNGTLTIECFADFHINQSVIEVTMLASTVNQKNQESNPQQSRKLLYILLSTVRRSVCSLVGPCAICRV